MNSETKYLWKVWVAAFMYTCVVSAFVQFILLPFILPRYHAGDGMFRGVPDNVGFHLIAADLAAKIKTSGWGVWSLSPGKQAPIGVASFIYALTWSKPWVLIPLNAAMHASAFLILFRLLSLFVQNKKNTILCALPFLMLPSSLQWTAQLGKDGFSILGVLLILQGLVSLSRLENYKSGNWFLINMRSIIAFFCGFILIRLVRPTMLRIIQPVLVIIFSLIIAVFLINAFKKAISWQKLLIVLLSSLLMFYMFSHEGVNYGLKEIDQVVPVSKGDKKPEGYEAKAPEIAQPKAEALKLQDKKIKNTDIEYHWIKLAWFPLFIENKIYSLAMARRGFRITSPEAGTNIDKHIGFNSIKSIFLYLPRAAQIAFLAPFPNYWFSEGRTAATSLMRKISALEMVIAYFTLFFLFYAVWYWRKHIEIWVISIFCISSMLIYGLVVCNIGTLYRMRYPFITALMALGIAGFLVLLERINIRKDSC